MPKNKKKSKSKIVQIFPYFNDDLLDRPANTKSPQSGDDSSEFNADENASTISNASTNMSYQDLEGKKIKKKLN